MPWGRFFCHAEIGAMASQDSAEAHDKRTVPVSHTYSEIYASNVENELRKEHSIPVRTHYAIYKDGTPYDDSYIRNLIPSVRHTYPFGNIFHRRYFNNW